MPSKEYMREWKAANPEKYALHKLRERRNRRCRQIVAHIWHGTVHMLGPWQDIARDRAAEARNAKRREKALRRLEWQQTERMRKAIKQFIIPKAQIARASIKRVVTQMRESPCADCGGVFHPCQMELDHRHPWEWPKSRRGHSISAAELQGVDCLCANCHKRRTHCYMRIVRKFLP